MPCSSDITSQNLAPIWLPYEHMRVVEEIKKHAAALREPKRDANVSANGKQLACIKYSGPGGIQTAKPNAAALHLVWQYSGDAARRRARWAKFQILPAFSLIFDVTKKIEKE